MNESNETLDCGGLTEVFLNSPPPYGKQYYTPQLVPPESARKCIVCPGDLLVRHPDGTLEKRKQSESDAYRIPVLGCLYVDCSLRDFVTVQNAVNNIKDVSYKEQIWEMTFGG